MSLWFYWLLLTRRHNRSRVSIVAIYVSILLHLLRIRPAEGGCMKYSQGITEAVGNWFGSKNALNSLWFWRSCWGGFVKGECLEVSGQV